MVLWNKEPSNSSELPTWRSSKRPQNHTAVSFVLVCVSKVVIYQMCILFNPLLLFVFFQDFFHVYFLTLSWSTPFVFLVHLVCLSGYGHILKMWPYLGHQNSSPSETSERSSPLEVSSGGTGVCLATTSLPIKAQAVLWLAAWEQRTPPLLAGNTVEMTPWERRALQTETLRASLCTHTSDRASRKSEGALWRQKHEKESRF